MQADIFRALGNEKRLQILEWLKDPRAHFPPQVDGDLVEDGVCGETEVPFYKKQGLVRAARIKQWTFYRRDEARLAEVAEALRRAL